MTNNQFTNEERQKFIDIKTLDKMFRGFLVKTEGNISHIINLDNLKGTKEKVICYKLSNLDLDDGLYQSPDKMRDFYLTSMPEEVKRYFENNGEIN